MNELINDMLKVARIDEQLSTIAEISEALPEDLERVNNLLVEVMEKYFDKKDIDEIKAKSDRYDEYEDGLEIYEANYKRFMDMAWKKL